MASTISSHLHALLVEIASKNRCNLPVRGLGYLIVSDRELLVDALVKELSETGLSSDDEPDQRGFEIEEIIDFIGSLPDRPGASSS